MSGETRWSEADLEGVYQDLEQFVPHDSALSLPTVARPNHRWNRQPWPRHLTSPVLSTFLLVTVVLAVVSTLVFSDHHEPDSTSAAPSPSTVVMPVVSYFAGTVAGDHAPVPSEPPPSAAWSPAQSLLITTWAPAGCPSLPGSVTLTGDATLNVGLLAPTDAQGCTPFFVATTAVVRLPAGLNPAVPVTLTIDRTVAHLPPRNRAAAPDQGSGSTTAPGSGCSPISRGNCIDNFPNVSWGSTGMLNVILWGGPGCWLVPEQVVLVSPHRLAIVTGPTGDCSPLDVAISNSSTVPVPAGLDDNAPVTIAVDGASTTIPPR